MDTISNQAPVFPAKNRLTLTLIGMAALLCVGFYSGCARDDAAAPSGVIILTHNLADIPDGVDHLHYTGYDALGQPVYESPEQDKATKHTLSGVGLNVVLLKAFFHTEDHEELNINTYPVNFAGSATAHISTSYRCTQFDPARLALVDAHVNGNLLIRGNLPMITNNAGDTCLPILERYFAYDAIDAKMKTRINGFDLDAYEILDITLIDNQSDRNQFTAEMNAFGLDAITCSNEWPPYNNSCAWNPEYLFETLLTPGRHPWGLIWWPIYACGSTPCNEVDTQTGLVSFKFETLSPYLTTLLSGAPSGSSGKSKRLIYFHCMQGADRTGALHAVYLMDADAGLSLDQAFEQASKGYQRGHSQQQITPAILPSCTYVGLAQKYCLNQNPGNTVKCALPARCVR